MKKLKPIFHVCFQNYRKWSADYRIWMVAILIFVVCFDHSNSMNHAAKAFGTIGALWLFPFSSSQFYIKLVFTLPLILILCNTPNADGNQILVLARTGMTKWLLGQVLYVITSSGIYYIYIFICAIITALPFAEISSEWGTLLQTMAYNSNAVIEMNINYIYVDARILRSFTPLSACWFTFLLSWLDGIMLGMIIFFCNMVSRIKYLGSSIAGVLVVLSSFAEQEGRFGMNGIIHYSPVSWTSLSNIDVGGVTKFPSFYYCVTVYVTISVILLILILAARKKCTINTEASYGIHY
ncbi:MAG: hypothetical protein ACI4J7_10730 [Ruminiclostridium sp.]